MKKMPGMFSCQEVHQHVAMGMAGSLGTWDRMRLRLHLIMCHHCARYVRQIAALGDHARRMLGRQPDPERCRRLEAAVMAHCDDGDNRS